MTTKLLGLFLVLPLFCWEPKEMWVHGRQMIYITEWHILFNDGSILKRFQTQGSSPFIADDKIKVIKFYQDYINKKNKG